MLIYAQGRGTDADGDASASTGFQFHLALISFLFKRNEEMSFRAGVCLCVLTSDTPREWYDQKKQGLSLWLTLSLLCLLFVLHWG